MYYLGWIVLVLIVLFWRRDIKEAKETQKYLMEVFRKERKEFDSLKEKYHTILKR